MAIPAFYEICMCVCLVTSVMSDTLWPPRTIACQASLSMGIHQARILEWVALPSFRGSSQPRDWTFVFCGSCIAGGFFTTEPLGKPSLWNLGICDWVTSLSLFTFMRWRRKWQPTPVFLPGESQGLGSLVGCRLWGRTELDMTEVT